MSDAPARWSLCTLNDVCDFVRGVTYTKTEARTEPDAGHLPLLRATNIADGLDLEDGLVYVPRSRVSSGQRLRAGDIVLATSSGSVSVVGKSAQLRQDWDGTFGAFCGVLRPNQAIEPRFLALYVQSESVRRRWSDAARGTNINNLKQKDLLGTPIYVPSIGEQRRIGDILEDHLSRLSSAESSLKKIRTKLEALTGLTAEWVHRGLFSVTAEGPLKALTQTEGRVPGRTKAVAATGVPDWHLPAEWSWASIDEISDFVTDGDHNPPKRVSKGIPHVTAKAVRRGRINLNECTFVSEEGFRQTASRYEPRANDVIVTCVGTIGRVAIVPPDIRFSADRNLAALRLNLHRVLPEYVALILNSLTLQQRMKAASSSTAQPHLYLRDLRCLPIAVPPLATQAALVQRAHMIFEATDRLAAETSDAITKASNLEGAISKAAFAGVLSRTESAMGRMELVGV